MISKIQCSSPVVETKSSDVGPGLTNEVVSKKCRENKYVATSLEYLDVQASPSESNRQNSSIPACSENPHEKSNKIRTIACNIFRKNSLFFCRIRGLTKIQDLFNNYTTIVSLEHAVHSRGFLRLPSPHHSFPTLPLPVLPLLDPYPHLCPPFLHCAF